MSKPYIINDANGNPINAKYPPNRGKYGDLYEGYKTWAEEVLFHRFGVLCYDVCFTYKNKKYFLLKEQNYVAVCDEHFTEEYEVPLLTPSTPAFTLLLYATTSPNITEEHPGTEVLAAAMEPPVQLSATAIVSPRCCNNATTLQAISFTLSIGIYITIMWYAKRLAGPLRRNHYQGTCDIRQCLSLPHYPS